MDSRTHRLGNLTSIERTTHGLIGHTSSGNFEVRIFTPYIIRITAYRSESPDYTSYAVIQDPQSVASSIHEDDQSIRISTGQVNLNITRQPVNFSFTDKNGNILNEDDEGLGTSWIGDQVTSYKKLQDHERFVGLGEKTGPLDRRGNGYQNWNTDAYAYHAGTDPLYSSMPFYIGIHHGRQYGIFLDNSYKSFFNFGASNQRFSSFSVDAGLMNYYFISGDTVAAIIESYTWLTGRIPLPPKWSLGYQQCRYSYYPDHEVLNLARTFREKEIPADAIVLDIHYMDKYKIFTWDSRHFKNPKALIDQLKAQHFEVVLMCDPGIKAEPGYEPYDDGIRKNVFLNYPDGKPYTGQVWPGWCHFPDFTRPDTREWWRGKLEAYSSLGVEGFWNDMNEIATWGNMLPDNIEFDFDGRKSTIREGRNLYGFQMARSTYEAARKLLQGKRPFNLTRSGFSGVQRYSAVWTGDNVSYDEHMMLGVRLVNSMGLTGIAFAGYDVGGFVGEASTKLFARWISVGALSPFFRCHTMINTKDSEPWSFGEEVEQISRNYIRFRYQLMPYLYSLFYEASLTGMPVQRSLAIAYSHDGRVYQGSYQHQYLFGPFILVAPVESNKELVKVFLPEGSWYYLFDGQRYEGNQEIIIESPIHKLPVFIKGGAIIPMQPPVAHTRVKVDTLLLHIYRGDTDTKFELYEDDGSSYDYEKGMRSIRTINYFASSGKLTLGKAEGPFVSSFTKLKLIFHGFDEFSHVQFNGSALSCMEEKNAYFLPLEKYDPINDPDSMGEERVKTATGSLSADPLEITW